MTYHVLTRLKYINYLKEVTKFYASRINHHQFLILGHDLLYTFLTYYRHLGQTVGKIYQGKDFILILGYFQQAINKFHMQHPIQRIQGRTLIQAVQTTTKVISIWFYANRHVLIHLKLDFKPFKTQRGIMKAVLQKSKNIRQGQQLCLDCILTSNQADFYVVNHTNLVAPYPKYIKKGHC